MGYLVISLDLELMYGVADLENTSYWTERVIGGRIAIPQILSLFSKYGIHASWCTVGMLMADNKKELVESMPVNKPLYNNSKLSNYDLCKVGDSEEDDLLHYASSLITKIKKVSFQEVGSHTFSHYYCLDEGQSIEEFEEDLRAAKRLAEKKGISLKSIVFPRNQINMKYIKVVEELGFTSYRGREANGLNNPGSSANKRIFTRIIRLIDHYINLTGANDYQINELSRYGELINIPSSRFLRPYTVPLKFAEKIRIRRIKGQIKHAAKYDRVFHLWWHPHNFGMNTQKNLDNLEAILKYVKTMENKYNMQSVNMSELSDLLNKKR